MYAKYAIYDSMLCDSIYISHALAIEKETEFIEILNKLPLTWSGNRRRQYCRFLVLQRWQLSPVSMAKQRRRQPRKPKQ